MTRARFVLGSDALRARFDEVRRAVICSPRDPDALRAEIEAMRDKVRGAHPVRGERFDVKHSPGGMVDVEFAVQYLVLSRAAAHPTLIDNAGNIALLQRAEREGLLPAGIGDAAADAYRSLRRLQHQARLNDEPTEVDGPTVEAEQAAVRRLWEAVFRGPPR